MLKFLRKIFEFLKKIDTDDCERSWMSEDMDDMITNPAYSSQPCNIHHHHYQSLHTDIGKLHE